MSCFVLFRPCIDSEERQVQLITTLDNQEVDLLTLEYIKVCVIPAIKINPFHHLFVHVFTVVSQIVSILNYYFPNGVKWFSLF